MRKKISLDFLSLLKSRLIAKKEAYKLHYTFRFGKNKTFRIFLAKPFIQKL